MFEVPILSIIFRRKDTALQVMDAIAKVKPKRLYISQDGPRNEEDKKEIMETRRAVLSKIDWNCNLTVWTHKKNLGLARHIPGAFDKFFRREKMGIYLEDDTLPSDEFFYFGGLPNVAPAPGWQGGRLHNFNQSELCKLLDKVGFKVLSIRGSGFFCKIRNIRPSLLSGDLIFLCEKK